MISSSLNADPFDAVFFLEEELDKINSFNKLINSNKINIIQSYLNAYYGWDKESEYVMRAVELPDPYNKNVINFQVYFVEGPDNYEEVLKIGNNFSPILYFPSTDAVHGSVIILESFLKHFILNYVSCFKVVDSKYMEYDFDMKNSYQMDLQVTVIDALEHFIQRTNPQLQNIASGISMLSSILKSNAQINYVYELSLLITLASIENYMKNKFKLIDSDFLHVHFMPFALSHIYWKIGRNRSVVNSNTLYEIESIIKLFTSAPFARESNNSMRWLLYYKFLAHLSAKREERMNKDIVKSDNQKVSSDGD